MRYDPETYAHLLASGRVQTWADGSGRWHALVPDTMVAPMLVARGAIWHELRQRYTTTDGRIPPRPIIERAPTTREGMAHYQEVA